MCISATVKGIPEFWLTVLLKCDTTAETIKDKDLEVLHFLQDITVRHAGTERVRHAGAASARHAGAARVRHARTARVRHAGIERVRHAGTARLDAPA